MKQLSFGLCGFVVVILSLCFFVPAGATVLFEDNFSSGINTADWNLETISGVTWGYDANQWLQSNVVENRSNRFLDITTVKNDFTDFSLTFDLKMNNEGNSQDYRAIYLRSNDNPGGNRFGYWVVLQNWDRTDSDWIGIAAFNSPSSWSYFAEPKLPFVNDAWYSFKVDVEGNSLKVKMWQRTNPEPDNWLFDVVDNNNFYSSGSIGFGNYWYASTNVDNVRVTAIVPEPSTVFLLTAGLAGVGLLRRKKKNV